MRSAIFISISRIAALSIGGALCVLLAGCSRFEESTSIEILNAELQTAPADNSPPELAIPSGPRQSIALPYSRDLRSIADEETEIVQRLWFRLKFDDPRQGSPGPLVIYFPRLDSSTNQLVLNGTPLVGTPTSTTTGWNTPILQTLPDTLLRKQGNELMLVTDSWAGAFLLTRPRIGELEQVVWRYRIRFLLQLDAVRAISTLFGMLGLFSILFWIRRRDISYLLFALAATAWILRLTQYYVFFENDDQWPAWMTVNSLLWAIASTYLYALSLSDRPHKLQQRVAAVGAVLIGIATLPPLGLIDVWVAAPQINLAAVILSVVLGVQLSIAAYRKRSGHAVAFAAALWISLALGAHDLMMQMNAIGQEGIYLLPYGAMLQVLTFAYAVQRRFADSVEQVAQLNLSLSERVDEAEQRLKIAYQDLSRLERQRAVDDERQRLMQEMHDGLGSTLMASLAMAEKGGVDQSVLAEALRECVQHLQLTVDSLEPMGGDLLTVLGTLRYRIGKRLEVAGLRLHWQATSLPALPWMDAQSALNVLRIMQEVLTNIVKHSGATDITLATAVVDNHACVRISDNGRGFDVEAWRASSVKGRGLRNMEHRVAQLRGRLDVKSNASGTTIELSLPLE
ncbi:MAG TPA: ATP-binding protein [Steroidobacteraceae bacterium]|nr:ATP-binding protein [Steroidobacteraceae bacterium]